MNTLVSIFKMMLVFGLIAACHTVVSKKDETESKPTLKMTKVNVYPVKFCKHNKRRKPVYFASWGLCINNTLYAANNDGISVFLNEISPGKYGDDYGMQAPCTFVVKEHCKVVEE